MAGEDVLDADVTPDQSEVSDGKICNPEPADEKSLREESRESGLKALPAEEKARIGQLIKLLAQERRDKNTYRQKLDEQTARLQSLEQERELGAQERHDKETYRQKMDEQSARLHTLEKECELGAQERRDKEAYRQKLDEQNARLHTLEQQCELGRQQEQELLSRVSRSLHLLRSYQRELKVTKEATKSEDTKLKENEQGTAPKRLDADRFDDKEPRPQYQKIATATEQPEKDSKFGNPMENLKVQASVQAKLPKRLDADRLDDKEPRPHYQKIATATEQPENDAKFGNPMENLKVQASVQTKPWHGDIDKRVEVGWDNIQTNLHTAHRRIELDEPMSKHPIAHAHSQAAPSAFRHVISQFQSPKPPLEPMQCLSPLPRAARSRSTSLTEARNHLVTYSLEPLMQSPLPSCPSGDSKPGRKRLSTPDQSPKRRPEAMAQPVLNYSPKPRLEATSMLPLWPLPRGATSRSSSHTGPQHHEMVTHSLEPLMQSPLPRKTVSRLSTPDRSPKRRLEPLAKPVWHQSPKPPQDSSMQPVWPLPQDATNRSSLHIGPQHDEMVHSLANSTKTSRASWPVLIQDGYYPPSMFDVLDSVESALSEGSTCLSHASSSNSKTASFGRSSSELARLQQEITDLELRVFGTSIAGSTGNANGAAFDNFSDLSASQSAMAALLGAPMSDDGTFLTVPSKREALAWGKSKA